MTVAETSAHISFFYFEQITYLNAAMNVGVFFSMGLVECLTSTKPSINNAYMFAIPRTDYGLMEHENPSVGLANEWIICHNLF